MPGFPSHTSLSPLHLQRYSLDSTPSYPLVMSNHSTPESRRGSSPPNVPRSIPPLAFNPNPLVSGPFQVEHGYEDQYADSAYPGHEQYPAYQNATWPTSSHSLPPGIRVDTSNMQYEAASQYTSTPSYSSQPWQFSPSAPYTETPQSAYNPYPLQDSNFSQANIATFNSPTFSASQLSPRGGSHTPTSPHSPASQGLGSDGDTPSSQLQLPLSEISGPLLSHQEQLQYFRSALTLPSVTATGPFVPQIMYKPHTNSDRRRYVEEVTLEAPIYFWATNPVECGIPLVDALHSRVRRLQNRDETVFQGRGPSVSIRLEWPGYRQWSRQIPTKDFRSPPGPITRAKLAKNVAKCVQRFIAERQNHVLEDETDIRWRVGNGASEIKLEDLVLVSIHHVSMGSWQPQLRLRRPFP